MDAKAYQLAKQHANEHANKLAGREKIKRSQLSNDSISLENIAFARKPNNLFNMNDVLEYHAIDGSTGEVEPSDSYWVVSDYIYVSPNQTYSTVQLNRYALYDEDLNFISSSGISTGGASFTTTSDSHFVRVQVANSTKDEAILNKGDTLQAYDDHEYELKTSDKIPVRIIPSARTIASDQFNESVVEPDATTFLVSSGNKYNKNTVAMDTSVDLNGNVITESGRVLSDFIKVAPESDYAKTDGMSLRVAEYDIRKQFIQRVSMNTSDLTIKTTNKTMYVRLSPTTTSYDSLVFNEGTEPLPYVDHKYILQSTSAYPIEIDSALVPEGGGGDGYTTGGEQVIYDDSATYTAGETKTIADVSIESVVDIIEFSSNGILSDLQIYYKESNGTEFLYDLVSNNGSGSVPNTLENMQAYGSSIINFVDFDDRNDVYKVNAKDLKFANGFRIVMENTDTVSKDISVRVVSRQYA